MLCYKFITATLLLSLGIFSLGYAQDDFYLFSAEIPASGEPAKGEPPCSDGTPTTADDIFALANEAGKFTQYGPIINAVSSNPTVANRLKVALGIHSGPSMCGRACGVLPGKPTRYKVCVDGPNGESCQEFSGSEDINTDFGGYWARAKLIAYQPVGDGSDYVTCFSLRNWKHDYPRHFRIMVWY